ncbi:uncharacterized protein VTP21DRAFT_1079 [Calcarisporiella thermophila]|uniref:uncharacterized protein n=1 Tax=Calcarisporiella thermophila TaxID=911321 RepID=UPI0037445FCB
MMAMVIWLRIVRPKVSNNISFTLSFWIGLADALYRAFYLLFMAHDFNDAVLPSNNWLCRILFWSFFFFPIWFSLLTVSITLDLQLSFIHGKLAIKQYQNWYLPLSTLVAFVATTPQLFYRKAWWNTNYKYISNDWPYETELALGIVRSIIILASILYSLIIVIISLCRVFRTIQKMKKGRVKESKARDKEIRILLSVLRNLGYPLVLIVCMPATCILGLLFITHTRFTPFGDATAMAQNVTSGMLGILGFVVFLFNPIFSEILVNWAIFKKWTSFQSISRSISHASTVHDQAETQSRSVLWMWKKSADKLIQPHEEDAIFPCQKVRFAFCINEATLDIAGSSRRPLEAIPLERMKLLKEFPKQYACVFEEEDMADPQLDSNGDVWMLGRRFCGAKGAHYILPNDEEETDRLVMQHYMFRSLFNNHNFMSPVRSVLLNGVKVLDVGCGPGTWTMEMAAEFPSSHFYGIDINRGFPEHIKPENCHFQDGNFLAPLPFADESFDFVFVRCVGLGVYQSEWPRVIGEIVRVLQPGGYLEVVELDYNLQGSGRAFRKLADGLLNTLHAREINPSWINGLSTHFNKIGLEDIKCISIPFPIDYSARYITVPGREWFMRLLDSLRPYLIQVMYISNEEYDEIVRGVEQEIGVSEICINLVCTHGKKSQKNATTTYEHNRIE